MKKFLAVLFAFALSMLPMSAMASADVPMGPFMSGQTVAAELRISSVPGRAIAELDPTGGLSELADISAITLQAQFGDEAMPTVYSFSSELRGEEVSRFSIEKAEDGVAVRAGMIGDKTVYFKTGTDAEVIDKFLDAFVSLGMIDADEAAKSAEMIDTFAQENSLEGALYAAIEQVDTTVLSDFMSSFEDKWTALPVAKQPAGDKAETAEALTLSGRDIQEFTNILEGLIKDYANAIEEFAGIQTETPDMIAAIEEASEKDYLTVSVYHDADGRIVCVSVDELSNGAGYSYARTTDDNTTVRVLEFHNDAARENGVSLTSTATRADNADVYEQRIEIDLSKKANGSDEPIAFLTAERVSAHDGDSVVNSVSFGINQIDSEPLWTVNIESRPIEPMPSLLDGEVIDLNALTVEDAKAFVSDSMKRLQFKVLAAISLLPESMLGPVA